MNARFDGCCICIMRPAEDGRPARVPEGARVRLQLMYQHFSNDAHSTASSSGSGTGRQQNIAVSSKKHGRDSSMNSTNQPKRNDKEIREVTVEKDNRGGYKRVRVVFGPHCFVDIFSRKGKLTLALGATHHGFQGSSGRSQRRTRTAHRGNQSQPPVQMPFSRPHSSSAPFDSWCAWSRMARTLLITPLRVWLTHGAWPSE